MAPRGGHGKRWDRDPLILDRLDEHQRILRENADKATARELICAAQGIDAMTYYRDEARIKELHRQRIAVDREALIAEADTWYREIITDADVYTTEAKSYAMKAQHQANKNSAVKNWSDLHELGKSDTTQVVVPVQVNLGSNTDAATIAERAYLAALRGEPLNLGEPLHAAESPDPGADAV